MKFIKAVVLTAAAVVLAGVLARPARAEVSFDVAYSNLSQHGSWLVSAQYGHVWQPTDYNRGWNPYYDGHWIYTDMGWVWVSDYEWGAIPYHYGTWVADPQVGWVWIPGRTWAASWVVFRTGGDYIGWAPVPPGFSVGMSINMGGPASFVYVSSHDFLAPRVRMSVIPMERANTFMNNTTVVNNIVIQNNVVVNRGPDYRTVEKATGRPIHQERIESVSRVAPFAHVTRAELAVDPTTAKHGVRVAEPVPASQPLPGSGKGGNHGQNSSPATTQKSSHGGQAGQPNNQAATRAPTPVTPSHADTTQQHANTQAQAKQKAQHDANAQAQEKQKAQHDANAQAQAKPNKQPNANAQAQDNPNTQQHGNAQAQADQKAQHDAQAQAQAKKHTPNKPPPPKDQENDKGSAPAPKEQKPQ